MTFFINKHLFIFICYNSFMKNITYKEIAESLEKSEGTIKNWKKSHPVLLEFVKIGAFCKKNNITIEKIKKCAEIHKLAKEDL